MAPHLERRQALHQVHRTGAAFIQQALPAGFCSRVAAEVAAAAFEKLPEHEGQVRQKGELLVLTADLGAYPAIKGLRDELTDAVRMDGAGIAGLDRWIPNEVSVQRYQAGAIGITPHLDLEKYQYLIAVFTVEGTARFTLCKNRAGDALAAWPARPGSLVLLRGPGLGGIDDGRPLHAITGPTAGQRISVGFRMAAAPTSSECSPTHGGRRPGCLLGEKSSGSIETATADLRARADRAEAEAGALRRERDELRTALEARSEAAAATSPDADQREQPKRGRRATASE